MKGMAKKVRLDVIILLIEKKRMEGYYREVRERFPCAVVSSEYLEYVREYSRINWENWVRLN